MAFDFFWDYPKVGACVAVASHGDLMGMMNFFFLTLSWSKRGAAMIAE